MRQIDFVRHGQPDTTIHDDLKRPLTLEGQQQSQLVAEFLQNEKYDAIFSSPALRAEETIAPLAKLKKMSIRIDERLMERKMPSWVADFHGYVEHQWSDHNFSLTGGESINQVTTRYLDFINDTSIYQKMIVSTHGTALSSVYEMAYPTQGRNFFDSLTYAEIVRVELFVNKIESITILKKFK